MYGDPNSLQFDDAHENFDLFLINILPLDYAV